MTVEYNPIIESYDYNGLGVYPFNFYLTNVDYIRVVHKDDEGNETELNRISNYTVVINDSPSIGGNIDVTSYEGTGGVLYLHLDVPYIQDKRWSVEGFLNLTKIELGFDEIVMMIQQLDGRINSGALKNGWRGDWVTDRYYETNDFVTGPDLSIYINQEDHVSGDWATDLANGKWFVLIDVGLLTELTETAVKAAEEALLSAADAAESVTECAQYTAVCQAIQSAVSQCYDDFIAAGNQIILDTTAIYDDTVAIRDETQVIKDEAVAETTAIKEATQDIADDAEQFKTDAQIAAGNALVSEVAAEGWANQAQSVACQDMSAFANFVARNDVNMVTNLIYDTSFDKDGGAWRDRTEWTSWYQEPLGTATRGVTRKFPAIAGIVVYTGKVAIHDLTEPDFPMWMTFETGIGDSWSLSHTMIYSPHRVAMTDGCLSAACKKTNGSGRGVARVDFKADKGFSHRESASRGKGIHNGGNILGRNLEVGFTPIDLTQTIPDDVCNDVAMTVLDSADHPTIAVATDGGVPVIDGPAGKGTVVNIPGVVTQVHFLENGEMALVASGALSIGAIPTVDQASVSTWRDRVYWISSVPAVLGNVGLAEGNKAIGNATDGLTLLKENPMSPSDGMVAYVDIEQPPMWQQGDIKAATLAETTTGVVGTDTVTELVTQNTLDDEENWDFVGGPGISIEDGTLEVDGTQAGNVTASQEGVLTIGKEYEATIVLDAMPAESLYVWFGGSNSVRVAQGFTEGLFKVRGICTGNDRFYIGAKSAGAAFTVSAVYLREVTELVTNGDFDDTTGWNPLGTTQVIEDGVAKLGTVGVWGAYQTSIPTVAGQQYRLSVNFVTDANRGILRVGTTAGTSAGSYDLLNEGYLSGTGIKEYFFTATSSTSYVTIWNDNGTSATLEVDSVRVVPATEEVTNGDFTGTGNVTGWTLGDTINNNGVDQADLTTSAISNVFMSQTISGLTIGEEYEISWESGGTHGTSCGISGQFVSPILNLGLGVRRYITVKATATSFTMYFGCSGANQSAIIDKVRVVKSNTSISNGELSSDRAWLKGSGWSIGSGTATFAAGSQSGLTQAGVVTTGRSYRCRFNLVSITAGGAHMRCGPASGEYHDTTGWKEDIIKAASTYAGVYSNGDSASFTVSDISIEEVFLVDGEWRTADELLENGEFNGLTTGWSSLDSGYAKASAGSIRVVTGDGYDPVAQVLSVVAGQVYTLTVDVDASNTAGTITVKDGTTSAGSNLVQLVSVPTGTYEVTFKATSSNVWLGLQPQSGTEGTYTDFDNVTCITVESLIGNGEFSSKRTWDESTATYTVSGGVATVTNTSNNGSIRNELTTTVGEFYRLTAKGSNGTGTARVYFNGKYLVPNGDMVSAIVQETSNNSPIICLVLGASGSTATFDYVSLEHVTLVNGNWVTDEELLSNGSFEGLLDDTVWEGFQFGIPTANAGRIGVINDGSGSYSGAVYQDIPTVPGQTYKLSWDVVLGSAAGPLTRLGTNVGQQDYGSYLGDGSFEVTFKALSTNTTLTHYTNTLTASAYSSIDNIYCKAIQNVVENGEFSSDRGWTKGVGWAIAGGVATWTGGTASQIVQNVNKIGEYDFILVEFTVSGADGDGGVLYLDGALTDVYGNGTHKAILDVSDKAVNYSIGFRARGTNTTLSLDNFTVSELVVPDRSYNNNPLRVVGQLTKAPVNTNCELVAYEGYDEPPFGFLEQPYNTDMNFGTGAFYDMFWMKPGDSNDIQVMTVRRTTSANGFGAWMQNLQHRYVIFPATISTVVNIIPDVWQFVCWVRGADGNLRLYVDGVLRDVEAGQGGDIDVVAPLRYGVDFDGTLPFQGGIALGRVGAGEPSADQIKHIYETEKQLFEEGRACTLRGNSNVITDLSYDSVTDKLFVATEESTDEFMGLVNSHRSFMFLPPDGTPVPTYDPTKSVSAQGGRVLVTDLFNTFGWAPIVDLRDTVERLRRKLRDAGPSVRAVSTGAGQTQVQVPDGFVAELVFDVGVMVDFTVTNDGFHNYVNVSASTGDITILMRKEV